MKNLVVKGADAFRMRPLTWMLLGLLSTILMLAVGPAFLSDTQWLQIGGVSAAVVMLIIGFWLIRTMNQRLARLAVVARALGSGEYHQRAVDNGRDAIGLLAHALNAMADRIQEAVGELEKRGIEIEGNRQKLEAQNQQLSAEYGRQAAFGQLLGALNTVDTNTIANKALDYLLRTAKAQLGQVFVKDQSGKKLVKIAEMGIDRAALHALVKGNPELGLPGEVLARREVIIVEDIDEKAFPLVNLGFAPVKIRCVIGMPIGFQNQSLGAVIIASLHTPEQNTMRALQNAVDALGSAMSNALTYKTVQQQAIRLEQANQELLEADRLRSEFVANMSHELRTPLNSIIGFSSILMKNRNKTLAEKDLDYAEKINRNGRHLLSLINDILDLSKIEAGRMEVEMRPTKVDLVARETVELLHTQAEARRLALELVVEEEIPEIRTDGDKLRQAIINLVGNAIKFTHQGGVTIRVYLKENAVGMDIIDTGIGIPEDKVKVIFEPFRQVDSSTTRQYGGTGLGLSITRSLVELLGGRISLQSEINKGSTFTILLPLSGESLQKQDEELPNLPNQMTEIPSGLRKLKKNSRVLIVDDDGDARDLLAHYVKDLGGEVLLAGDGEEALRLAEQHRPDLITLDLMLPGMDGWEILRKLKANPILAQIPVVIISIVADRRHALVLGAMDALTKPIAQDDLMAILRRTLKGGQEGRILVVDDNDEVRELFGRLLEDKVKEVRFAENGRVALSILNDYEPDLIFLDLMMPEMDGLTFLRVMRSDPKLLALPVVVVTAKQLSSAERRELEMRVAQVIQKGDAAIENQLAEALQNAFANAYEVSSP